MQFGRLIGGCLGILGILLLFLELSFFMNVRSRPELRREDRGFRTEARHVPALPGVLGGVFVISGAAVFLMARIEDEPDAKHALK